MTSSEERIWCLRLGVQDAWPRGCLATRSQAIGWCEDLHPARFGRGRHADYSALPRRDWRYSTPIRAFLCHCRKLENGKESSRQTWIFPVGKDTVTLPAFIPH